MISPRLRAVLSLAWILLACSGGLGVAQAMAGTPLPGSTVLPSPSPGPTSAADAGSGGACVGPICAPTVPDLGQLLSNAIVSGLTTLLADFITWLSGLLQSIITWATAGSTCTSTNASASTFTLLSSTPPCLTWTNPYVQQYATLCRTIALALVALLICLHGLEIALATRAGHLYDGPLDALRRVALAAVLGSVLIGTNGSNGLFGAVLSLANALTAAVGGTLPSVPVTGPDTALQEALVDLLYLIMELILIVQLLLRLALLDLLMVIAPLAVLCYAYPRWAHWATHWAQLMASTVLLQFLQVTALQVSARMVASLDVSSASAASESVLQTLLGIAGLVLVVRVPRLLYGLGSGVLSGSLPFTVGWGSPTAGTAGSPAGSGGTTTVTPEETLPLLASGGSSGSAAALLPGGGPQGGSGMGGPLYPGGSSGGGMGLFSGGGLSAGGRAPSGGLVPSDDGDNVWGPVIITEVPPAHLPPPAPQLDGPQPPLLPAGGSPDATPPPGGWP